MSCFKPTKKTASIVAAVLIALVVSGCATYEWYKPGHSPAERDADMLACEREALRMYPERFETEQVEAARVEPEKSVCTTNGNTRTCITEPARSIPAKYAKEDVNAGHRDNATNLCMGSKGYLWVEIKKN